jgi:hypothetical protein
VRSPPISASSCSRLVALALDADQRADEQRGGEVPDGLEVHGEGHGTASVAAARRPAIESITCSSAALADAAERNFVAGEHDAVELRAVEGLRVVVGALESADQPERGSRANSRVTCGLLLAKGASIFARAGARRGSACGGPATRAARTRTPLWATTSATAWRVHEIAPLQRLALSSSAVALGSHGSMTCPARRRRRGRCSTRPPVLRSDGRTHARKGSRPTRCPRPPSRRQPKMPPPP